MNKHKNKFWLAFPCVVIAIGLFIWFFQWLWNLVLPDVIGVKVINYWQSFGILVLSKILFGGLGNAKEKFRNRRKLANGDKSVWEQKLENTFCGSEEEREKMKQMWKEKFESKFCKHDSDTKTEKE